MEMNLENQNKVFLPQVCARVLANSIRNLADSALLPHDFITYGKAMSNALQLQNYGDWIKDINKHAEEKFKDNDKEYKQVKINFAQMTSSLSKNVEDFTKEAKAWARSIENKGSMNTRFCALNLLIVFRTKKNKYYINFYFYPCYHISKPQQSV